MNKGALCTWIQELFDIKINHSAITSRDVLLRLSYRLLLDQLNASVENDSCGRRALWTNKKKKSLPWFSSDSIRATA